METNPSNLTIMLVADSSGLISLMSPADRNHHAAKAAVTELADTHGHLLIPGDVFSETINVIGKRGGHLMASDAAAYFLSAASFVVVETGDLRAHALRHFRDQPQSV